MLSLISQLKNNIFQSFETDGQTNNSSYGKIKIITDNISIELINETKVFP